MATEEYIAINKANWDERAPVHANASDYCFDRLLREPDYISDVVAFDVPTIGDITNLEIVHLQCHIATDSLSLVRRGAKRVVGLDFSPAAIKEARRLAANAAGGDKLSFVQANVYDALNVLEPGSFDMVFTGIGALCWLPSINRWAEIVSALLKPGGRLFIREGHPTMWAIDERITSAPTIGYPYFERAEPSVVDQEGTYIETDHVFQSTRTMEWNHGLGEIIQALIDVGLNITKLSEEKSLPWCALPGQMEKVPPFGEWSLIKEKDNLPLSYTLQAVKRS